MEQLIFGFVSLITFCVFLALSALPFYLANRIGNMFDVQVKRVGLRFLLPVLLLAIVAAWVWATYFVFKRDCRRVPEPTFLTSLGTRPDGFSFYEDETVHPMGGIRWDEMIERGHFLYVDSENGRRRQCAGTTRSENPKIVNVETRCDAFTAPKAETSVYMLRENRVNYWWHPPIYTAEIQVKDKPLGTVIAAASDLIIGGGLVGLYLIAIGGDQDYEYLSCGYASTDIGPWRPSLTSRPRFSQYTEADVTFVVRALSAK